MQASPSYKYSTHQIGRHLNSSSVFGHYHSTPLAPLRRTSRTRAPVQVLFGGLHRPWLFGFQRHHHDVSSVLRDDVPPTKRVIVERRIFDSEVATRVPEAPSLKLPKGDPALRDTWKVNNGIGVILHISRAVDRHLRGTELSEGRFQPLAVVDNRHLFVDGATSLVQNDGVVEVKNQNACRLQLAVSVLGTRFLAAVPVRATPDIRRIQVRSVQALVFCIDKTVMRYIRMSQALQSASSRGDLRIESRCRKDSLTPGNSPTMYRLRWALRSMTAKASSGSS